MALLKLLTNDVRWRLVAALAASDRKVNELVQAVGQPANLVSYHLGHLRAAGIVSERRSSADARDVYYSLDLERLRAAFERCAGAIHPGLWPETQRGTSDTTATRVLFLCTHNSARSQMAEAILRQQGGMGIDGAGLHAKPFGMFAADASEEEALLAFRATAAELFRRVRYFLAVTAGARGSHAA